MLAFQTYLNFSSTLTRLSVPYYNKQQLYEVDHEEGDALYFLPSFKNLKHLIVRNKVEPV